MRCFLFTLLLLVIAIPVPGQETDIIPYLKLIEEGKQEDVISKIPDLQKQHPEDPSVIFLQAVVISDADSSLFLFNKIIDKYPRSRYADAALYRVYSYNFALGLYSTAQKNLEKLKKDYPESPYIRIAERNIPENDEPAMVTPPKNITESGEPKTVFKYTIQAGAFSNKKNSSSLLKQFRDAGYDAEIKEKLVGGTSFDVVYVGKFSKESDALEFLNLINRRYNLDGRVVETGNGK